MRKHGEGKPKETKKFKLHKKMHQEKEEGENARDRKMNREGKNRHINPSAKASERVKK